MHQKKLPRTRGMRNQLLGSHYYLAGIRPKIELIRQQSSANIFSPKEEILVPLRVSMTAASLKPSVTRAVDGEPNERAREWLDAVHAGNDAPRILLARGPATASAFGTGPTRVVSFQGRLMPFPLVSRCCLRVKDPNKTPASVKSPFGSESLHTAMPESEALR